MAFFTKSLAELTIEDIHWLVEKEVRETSDLEFKALPPDHGGKGNVWIKSDGAVTRDGKEALLKELVAFANASGGTLVFGISDEGSRASGITPVPKVEECAERLKLICRDSIEPAIPQMEIQGIPIPDADGAGVIVFRVKSQSPMGPHRSNTDKEFYIRRNDRSDPMTVDEIRRYSIDLHNRLNSIESRFEVQSQALFKRARSISAKRVFALSCHLIPILPLHADNLFPWLRQSFRSFNLDVYQDGKKIGDTFTLIDSPDWSPVLRGTRGTVGGSEEEPTIEITVGESGEIAITWIEDAIHDSGRAPEIYLSWIIGMLSNGILLADRLQKKSYHNEIEYWMTFSIHTSSPGQPLLLQRYSGTSFRALGRIPNGSCMFPTIQISSRRAYSDACSLLDKDFCDYAGYKGQHLGMMFDFVPAFKLIDTEFNIPT